MPLRKLRTCSFIAESNVQADFEGSEKPIVLDNGMIFEATSYNYSYSYRPEALVLEQRFIGHSMCKVIRRRYDVRCLR